MPDAVTSSNSGLGGQARQRIGKYQIFGRVGRGGMGSVHRAYDPVLERLVALKVISASADLTDELRARFFLEAQACARLAHPNIVTIYDLGEIDGQLFIVMELLDGEELRQLVARRSSLPLRDKLSMMLQLCEGLEYAHGRGILHRDIKPGNIFVQRDGRVKILDFGVARIEAADTPVTRTGLLVGTLQYMAPERVRGHGDLRSDIFSVGAVLYELLTYRAAFGGADPMQILEQLRAADPIAPSQFDPLVPPELDAVVRKALDKDPARRFENLGEMHAELRAIQRQLAAVPDAPLPDAATEASERVRGLRDALLARIGTLDRVTSLGQRPGTAPDVGSDLARLQSLVSRAERLQPILDDGLAAMARRDFETAVSILTLVVRDMPEHARAAESLSEARRRAESSRAAGPGALDEPRATGVATPAAEPPSGAHRLAPIDPVPADATAPGRDDDVTLFAEVPVVVVPPGPGAGNKRPRPNRIDAVRALVARRVSAWPSTVAGWRSAVRRLRVEHPLARRRVLGGIGGVLIVAIAVGLLWPRTTHRPTDRSAELRTIVAGARESALRAEAPALAATTFSAGEAASAEAERLAKSGRPADLASAFRTATDRYEAAAREAGRTREQRTAADRDRQRMLVVKQRAPENGTEFSAALEHERRGDALYTKLEFENAARSFSTAAELYSKTVAPAPPLPAPAPEVAPPRPDPAPRETARPSPPDPRGQIRGRLAEYVKAIETKNLTLLRQVRPGLGEAELRLWARAFDITRSRKVALTLHDIAVDGEQARVTGRRAEVVVFNDGQERRSETRFVCALALRREGWVIVELHETQDAGPDGTR
jgi:serine/threonine-protein kinase